MKNCTICQKEFNNDSTYLEAKKKVNKHINSNALMQEDCLCIDCIKNIVHEIVEDAFNEELDSDDIPFYGSTRQPCRYGLKQYEILKINDGTFPFVLS